MTRARSPVTGRRALAVRDRQDKALHLRREGLDYPTIAHECGYSSAQSAGAAVKAALDRHPAEDAAAVRQVELARYDALWEAAWRQLNMDHVMVQQGRIIDGVVDEAAKLAAIDRLLRIAERRARLLGLDAPTRARIEVVTQDVIDSEIQRLEAELADRAGDPAESAASGGTAET